MREPLPINYTCNQKRNQTLGVTNTLKSEEDQWVEAIKENFLTGLDYTKVYKNLDMTQTYDTWVFNGNKDEKNLGSYKKFLSYPYTQLQFDIGDYVSFTYGGSIHNWLITSLDKKLYYDIVGNIERCNINLKWEDDNGIIYNYPAVTKENWNSDDPLFNSDITVNKGKISIVIQYNEFTKFIKINKRFLIGDPYQAVKVVSLVNYTDTNTLTLSVIVDNKASDDNETIGIANYNSFLYTVNILESDFSQQIGFTAQLHSEVKLNDNIITSTVLWSSSNEAIATIDQSGNIELLSIGSVVLNCEIDGNSLIYDAITVDVIAIPIVEKEIIISPLVTTLLQEREQIYDVYLFENGIQQLDTFTFTDSDVPNIYYQFDIIDGNSFKITNLQMYLSNPLRINCISGLENKDFYIDLKGLW